MTKESIKNTVVNELHKPIRLHFRRRKYIQKGIADTLQIDLVSIADFKDKNRGYKYILTVIDIFSKFAFAAPLLTKNGKEVTKAFEKILNKYGKKVKNVHCDKGTEFYNKEFKDLMKRKNINMYSTTTKIKAGIVERFNRTLKNLMWKNFGYTGEYNWIDHLDNLVDKYNNTKHRTIGIEPSKVRKKHEKHLLNTVYKNMKIKLPSDLKINDYVRISDLSGTFRRGFRPNWSAGIFKVAKIQNTVPVTFKLIDYNNKKVDKIFYRQELQKVKHPNVYLVHKILKKKGKKALVNWLGFDSSYNSWINLEDIV